MSNLTIFKNEDFGDIRTTLVDNQPYFCLADVCRILDIKNVSDCKDRLKKDGVVNNDVIDSLGRRQVANFINESNLYKCIFQSRQPYAEKFQDWVTEEIVPEIRKTGSYSLVPKSYAEALRLYADEVEQRELMQKQRDEAIRTKAYISDKKTATAMNTASQKSREVEKLKRELDKSKEFASIKAAEIRLKSKFDWKPLRNYCTSHELEMPKIFDANYGSVRTYPAEAWQEIYGVDLKELF